MTQEKIMCPIKGCDKEPTGLHRFINHFRGTHIRGKDSRVIEETFVAIDSLKNDEVRKALLKEFSEYGPELDDADEEKVDVKLCDGKDEVFIINQYLKDAICREERQYALFLANGLKKNNSAIKDMLELSAYEILEVYYEATLMRDYWCRNRVIFNGKLKNFVETKKPWGSEIGSNDKEKNHANYWSKKHPLACWMMNAKPDLAVLYRENSKKLNLSFIECKYLSRVDNYYYNKDNTSFSCTQVELQKIILEFLCNVLELKYSLENSKKNVKVNEGEVIIARFVKGDYKDEQGKGNDEEKVIPITKLREIGY